MAKMKKGGNAGLPSGCYIKKYPSTASVMTKIPDANIELIDKQMNGDISKAKSQKSKRKF